jgi:hypothetical protein
MWRGFFSLFVGGVMTCLQLIGLDTIADAKWQQTNATVISQWKLFNI